MIDFELSPELTKDLAQATHGVLRSCLFFNRSNATNGNIVMKSNIAQTSLTIVRMKEFSTIQYRRSTFKERTSSPEVIGITSLSIF